MIVVSRTSTAANRAYGCESPCTVNETAAFYYIFKFYYVLGLYIVFCILPLYCVRNYPKRRVLWQVTVESASKIHLPIVYGWQFRIFEDGFDNIWLPDFHRAIKNIPSPSLRIQRLFAVNKSATFH